MLQKVQLHYEVCRPEDRQKFVQFVKNLKSRSYGHQNGNFFKASKLRGVTSAIQKKKESMHKYIETEDKDESRKSKHAELKTRLDMGRKMKSPHKNIIIPPLSWCSKRT